MSTAFDPRRTGEFFILGFRGYSVPGWIQDFEREYGLGGVILFDYDCSQRKYENNIESREQVRALCLKVQAMSSRPLIVVDQEGGKVRRLKESKGFAPLPSALQFNRLSAAEKARLAEASFVEQRELGFSFDLAPVVDLNTNPKNPDIGAVERSFSDQPDEVRENVRIVAQAARRAGLGLCLKHYPGLGGATVNSHLELTDLTGTVTAEQLRLFYELVEEIPGAAILVSHGMVRDWDPELPASMSPKIVGDLRARVPDALLISDDLQMQGLQKKLSSLQGSIQGLRAGLDLICIGNNLMHDDSRMPEIAEALRAEARRDSEFARRLQASAARIRQRKLRFAL